MLEDPPRQQSPREPRRTDLRENLFSIPEKHADPRGCSLQDRLSTRQPFLSMKEPSFSNLIFYLAELLMEEPLALGVRQAPRKALAGKIHQFIDRHNE